MKDKPKFAQPSTPKGPGRGSTEFLLQSLGVGGGAQFDPTKVQSMEDVIYMGLGWGFSREEVVSHLSQKPDEVGTPADAAAWLTQQYAEQYGGTPPTTAGEEGRRYPAYAWRQIPGGRQARARMEMAGYKAGTEYRPEDWQYPFMRRQGQSVPWSVEAITGTYPGIPGSDPGTYMTSRAEGEAGDLKIAKDVQRGGVYPEIELRHGETSLMQTSAFKMGPLSQRRERGFQAPMALLGEEWLPEGMMMLPEDFYTTGNYRFSKDIFLPKDFEPDMVPEGTQWTHGKVRPFEGAAALNMGLGRTWSSVTMHSYSIATGRKWNARAQKWEEGRFLRMGFEASATPEMLRLSSKTFGAKYMAPMGGAAKIHGIKGHGISEIKDPTMLPVMWWANKPREAAAALSKMRGQAITPEQLEQMSWAEVGRDLTTYFREEVLPSIYQEKPLEFDVHTEYLPMLPKGRFKSSPIESRPEMAHVTTDPVPMLVGDWAMMGRRGWPVKQPNIPFREMEMIEDVAKSAGAPDVLWDIQKQARPAREAYSELISASLMGQAKEYAWPRFTQRPTAIEAGDARAVVGRAHLAFQEKYGDKMPTDIPGGLSILNSMIMQEAQQTWSSAISLGDAGVLASPKTATLFGAQGVMAGTETTGYVSAYAGAIRAAAEGVPEDQAKAYDRAVTAQRNLAGSGKMLRKAMQSNVPRAIGDVLYPDLALGAGEIALAEEAVLKRYGVKKQDREAFVRRWKASEITPTALVWGHPTTGREMFARQVAVVHPDVLEERGGMLGEKTPFRASPMLAEMMGRDFDEDNLWALMTGHLTGAGNTIGIKSPSIPMATAEWVKNQSETIQLLGRSSLAPGAGVKKPPGMDDEEWSQMGGLQRFQASVDPQYLRQVGAEDQFSAQRNLARRQAAIGVRYNIMEDIIATAASQGHEGAAEHLHLAVHGRGQTPAKLTPALEKMMNYLEGYASKGSIYQRFGKSKEEGRFGSGAGTGSKGASGLQMGLLYAGLGAVTEKSITPEMFGDLFYPEGRAKEGASLARRWAVARGGSGARASLSNELMQMDPEEWIRTSVMGTVGGAHMLRRAQAKGVSSYLSPETEEHLGPWQDRYAMLRAFRSKRGDKTLEERVRAAVTMNPEQADWLGSFGMMAEYKEGTLWSRLGKALVGEEGPELIEEPESEHDALVKRLGFDPGKFGVEGIHIMSKASMRALIRRRTGEEAASSAGVTFTRDQNIYVLDPAYYDEKALAESGFTSEQRFRHIAAHETGHVWYNKHAWQKAPGSETTTRDAILTSGPRALDRGRISAGALRRMYGAIDDSILNLLAGRELFAEQFAERLTGLHYGAYSETGPGPSRRVVHNVVTDAGYQSGTLSSRSGQALVGEEGPEVVDLPEGSVVHPATSIESQDAVTARAVETGQMQRFAGGGAVMGDPVGAWEGIDDARLEQMGREYTAPPQPRAPTPRQETYAPPVEPVQQRATYPPKVSAEDFRRSLQLYSEGIDDWVDAVEAAGGITTEFNEGLTALTKQVLSWKSHISKGLEYGTNWQGREMEQTVRVAQGLLEPGAEGDLSPWEMLGGIKTAQARAKFQANLGRAGLGAPGATQGAALSPRALAWLGDASAAELQQVSGLGEVLGGRIAGAGRFSSTADVTAISGIGDTSLAAMAPDIERGAAWWSVGGREGVAGKRQELEALTTPEGMRRYGQLLAPATQAYARDITALAKAGIDVSEQQQFLEQIGATGEKVNEERLIESARVDRRSLDTTLDVLTERFEKLSKPVAQIADDMERLAEQWEETGAVPPALAQKLRLATEMTRQMDPAIAAVRQVEGAEATEAQAADVSRIRQAQDKMRLLDAQGREARGAGFGYVSMYAAGWAGGPAIQEAARGAHYVPVLAGKLGEMGVPGLSGLTGMGGAIIGAGIGLGMWGAKATMPGDPRVQASTWQQMQIAAQYGGGQGAMAEAGLGLRALGLGVFHAPTIQRYGEAMGMYDEVNAADAWLTGAGGGTREAAEAFMREEGRAGGVRAWAQTAAGGGIPIAEMLAETAFGMTDFQRMQMQEYISPFAQGDPIAWAQFAQQGAPITGWESAAGIGGMPSGVPASPVEQVSRGGVTAWMQTGTQELWGLQDELDQIQIQRQEFQQEQAAERLKERRIMTGETRQIRGLEREASRDFQYTQFGWQLEDIETQWERGGLRLDWASEDLERRRKRTSFDTQYQQEMLTYRYGMQQTQFAWAGQDLQKGFGRQQTQFGWQEEDLAFRGAQTTMQYGWQMEDFNEALRYATGRDRRKLLRQRERATTQFGMGMGRLDTEEGRLEERREWATEDFETEKQRLEQRKAWAQDLYTMQMDHLRERRGWNQEDYEREKQRLEQRRTWLDEDRVRETERHGVKLARWEESLTHEDALRELTEAAEDAEIARQEQALIFTETYLGEQERIHLVTKEIQRNQALSIAAWNQFFKPGGDFRNALAAMQAVLTAGGYGGAKGGYEGKFKQNPYGE